MAKVRSRGTGILIKIALTVAVIYLLYIFIGLQVRINKKQDQINSLDEQISAKTAEKAELTSILDADVDTEYIERVARELGYINSDEKVYEMTTD